MGQPCEFQVDGGAAKRTAVAAERPASPAELSEHRRAVKRALRAALAAVDLARPADPLALLCAELDGNP